LNEKHHLQHRYYAQRTAVFDYTWKAVVEEIRWAVHPKELGAAVHQIGLMELVRQTQDVQLAQEKSSQHWREEMRPIPLENMVAMSFRWNALGL
jgi:hypothetical protein